VREIGGRKKEKGRKERGPRTIARKKNEGALCTYYNSLRKKNRVEKKKKNKGGKEGGRQRKYSRSVHKKRKKCVLRTEKTEREGEEKGKEKKRDPSTEKDQGNLSPDTPLDRF